MISASVSATAITSTPSGGSLAAGGTVNFALSASAAVQVTPASGGGQPALALNNGGMAAYAGTDAGGSLLFNYAVATGEDTPDLKVTGLSLNGATITSVGGTAFQLPASYAVGSGPYSSAVADLNSDGAPDLVVGNGNDSTVSVLLGDGQGGFGAQTAYTISSSRYSTYSVAAVDLNGDGKPDIIAADGADGTASVLLNDGQGGFSSSTSYATGAGTYTGYFITVADVTGDGKPDLITSNGGFGTVSVLPGDGRGGFGAPTSYAAGPSTGPVTAADLNGDGKPDLVVVNQSGNTISVLLNDGQGGFGAPASYTVGPHPNGVIVAAADLNGDGRPDLVVPNRDDGTVSVLLNDGQGGFGPQATYAVGTTPVGGAATDINGDGKLDFVVGNEGDNTVSVLLGNGDGTFGTQMPFAAGSGSDFISTADLNGDGKPDLVASDYYGGAVSVLLNASTAPGQALDAFGLAALGGADTGLVIDTTPPAAPAGLALAPASDTGTSDTDGVTRDPAPVVTGTAEAGSTVVLSEGASVLGRATATAGGTWSVAVGTLAEGSHQLTVIAADAAGNLSQASQPFALTVDTTPPAVTAAAAASPMDANPGGLTYSQILAGGGDPNAVVTISEGGHAIGTAQANAAGRWSYDPSGLAPGGHTLVASETDAAGNTGATPGVAFTVPNTRFSVTDVTASTSGSAIGSDYRGPVGYLQAECIYSGSNNVVIGAKVANVFLKSGTGMDALAATAGSNVLDGGAGSNWLVGASGADGGTDTFFVDGRGGQTTWDTLLNFHAGDQLTLWGYDGSTGSTSWSDNQGAVGYQGATLHADFGGGSGVSALVTFAGIAAGTAQFTTSAGTVDGTSYLAVTRTA